MFLFVLIALLMVWDIAADLAAGTTVFHVTMELLIMFAAIFGAIHFWNQLRVARKAEKDLERDLEKAQAETARWQEEEQELLDSLRKAINKKFTQWDLSVTEREIAFYLLKGMSLKEIAKARGSTFSSIKQQAHVLYHKAGLGSRAELSAFFLGGLLHEDLVLEKVSGKLKSQGSNQTRL